MEGRMKPGRNCAGDELAVRRRKDNTGLSNVEEEGMRKTWACPWEATFAMAAYTRVLEKMGLERGKMRS